VVVAETERDRPAPVTLEMMALARDMAGPGARDIHLLVLGDRPEALAGELATLVEASSVWAVQAPELGRFHSEMVRQAVRAMALDLVPDYLLAVQTLEGMDVFPSLAPQMAASVVTAVEAFRSTPRGPLFQRAVLGGKVMEWVDPGTPPVILTIQPGAFSARPAPPQPSPVRVRRLVLSSGRTTPLPILAPPDDAAPLTEADVVVAAGRGIGKQENLALIERLANLFPRSAVAGSRPICDLGWLPYSRQVGQTGQTVTPRLYFACGISGARQHTLGMRGSGFVAAISIDPSAPIFLEADVGVVEDLVTFLPVLFEEYNGMKNDAGAD
jgi:electron transfer flavoprotein alpha subunit